MRYEAIDVYRDGTTTAIQADNEQVELIVKAIRKALPLFITENEQELVEELRAILAELET